MIKLSINYSKEFEQERVESTLNRLDWYLSNKYSLNSLSFPQSFDTEKLKDISREKIIKGINDEYDEDKFISTADEIQQIYEKYETRLEDFIKNIGLEVIPNIKVYLTGYGMGGSYHLPNEIIINISKSFSVGRVKTILHEIIHLHIQRLIDQHKISQWDKEAIVNLLFEKVFPEIYKEPNIPIDTTKTKKVFEENFPNIEKIISLTPST
jgi:hypothetical protein